MARPGLSKHPKFKRLVHLLKEPMPHVRGYLELLWEVGYEAGNPVIGDKTDVALACEYPGDSDRITGALLKCGEEGCPGFIEEIANKPGRYQIHDLFDHAPEYVRKRQYREQQRKNKDLRKICPDNGRHVRTGSPETAALPLPLPLPHPSREVSLEPSSAETAQAEAAVQAAANLAETREGTPDGVNTYPNGFAEFWSKWPPGHFRKKGKAKCERHWKKSRLERVAVQVIQALERCKVSPDWLKQGGAFIPLPLSWLNDTPWQTDAAEMAVGYQTTGDEERDNGFVPVRPSSDELLAFIREGGGG